MLRRQYPATIDLPTADVTGGLEQLKAVGEVLQARIAANGKRTGDLQVHVRHDGQVRVWRRSQGGRYPIIYPVFTGHVEQERIPGAGPGKPGPVQLTGTAVRNRWESVFTGYCAAALGLPAFAALAEATGWYMLAILTLAATWWAPARRWFAARPRPQFAADVTQMLDMLTAELGALDPKAATAG